MYNLMMRRVVCATAGILLAWAGVLWAESSDGRNALPANLDPLPKGPLLGFPSTDPNLDVFPGFVNPPKGYGNVPFYWWNGDKLTRERLAWQLDQLAEAGTDGYAVSYIHSHVQADKELNAKGYAAFGRTMLGDPPAFSEEWWKFWNVAALECAKRGMGLGLDDYTFNWPGNGSYIDELTALPEMKAYLGQVQWSESSVQGGKEFKQALKDNHLAAFACPRTETGVDYQAGRDLKEFTKDGQIAWTAPAGKDWTVVTSWLTPNYMLHPKHGQELCRVYFQRFEDRLDPEARKGMNFFFQDELGIPLHLGVWSEDFRDEFRKRKDYDIAPLLPALRKDIGPMTAKVRLDYWDVVMELAEQRYFKPVFDWHWKRGLIYGCDNNGRGLSPTEYGDYYRATRWFSAPGNDAPARGLSFIQTKVSSSISHMYERPRTWLEAFHSMGWASCPEWLTEQLDRHYQFGGNLLCLHGLYYSTHGSWWEWAPPDFHFRMPYWPHAKAWFKYAQRLSYLLSQGRHVADVAILYPTAAIQAGVGNQQTAFQAGTALFNAGIDFDFLDDQSVARAEVKDGKLCVGGEQFGVLILPDVKAVRYSTVTKILQFFRAGGKIISIHSLPLASDRVGADDVKVDEVWEEVFDADGAEVARGEYPETLTNAAGGWGVVLSPTALNAAGPQPAEATPAPAPAGKAGPQVRQYEGGFASRFVWSPNAVPKVSFKAVWPPAGLPADQANGEFQVKVLIDNFGHLYVNGQKKADIPDYQRGWTGTLALKAGDVITIDATDTDNGDHKAGLFFAAVRGGKTVMSAEDLACTAAAPSEAWRTDKDVSKLQKVSTENVHEAHSGAAPRPGAARRPAPSVAMPGLVKTVSDAIVRDFIPPAGMKANVLHRKAGNRDVYMVMDVPAGTECFFRAKGKVEHWDAWTGKTHLLSAVKETPHGLVVRIPVDPPRSSLIVFTPGDPTIRPEPPAPPTETGSLDVTGPWETELVPTMDNRWGDFRKPASPGLIGPEARVFRTCPADKAPAGWEKPDFDDSKWRLTTHGFGPKMWLAQAPASADFDAFVKAAASEPPAAGKALEAGGVKTPWQPYEFSWRWGVENQPGSQGYHGLKHKLNDGFLILGAGGHYVFRTALAVDRKSKARIGVEGVKPACILLDGKSVTGESVELEPGVHQLVLGYKDTPPGKASGGSHAIDDRPRSAVVLVAETGRPPALRPPFPLAMKWYRMEGLLGFDARLAANPEAKDAEECFRFVAPPGLQAMSMVLDGSVVVWVDGQQIKTMREQRPDGDTEYQVRLDKPLPHPAVVALSTRPGLGALGGAAFVEPVAITCQTGRLEAGDWSKVGCMLHYSGGMWYRRTIPLTAEQAGGRVLLDLGEVVATAEVRVNGQSAGVLINKPFIADLTGLAKAGDNRVEVLVYNTLSNHYQSTPTPYKGNPVSGLIGPVKLVFQAK